MDTEVLEKKIEDLEHAQAESTMKPDLERRFLEVLCRDYTAVYHVGLKDDFVEPLTVSSVANAAKIPQMLQRIRSSYTEIIRLYCDKYVAPANSKEFLRVMQRESLLEELSKKGRVVYRYESVPNAAGQRFFEVQIVCIDEKEFDGNVILAFHHIDDIMTIEQKYQWELEKLAYLDSLTGLENRVAFTRELNAFENKPNAACIVADVNNLKLCNDRYGHIEGDRAIKDAGECLSRAFEGMGKCYRIGGDEFCVLIEAGEQTKILASLGQFEGLIEEKNQNRVMPISVACGYGVREKQGESMEQLFNRSDEMMYDVKYRMKREFPVYCEERIRNYLNVLNIVSKSTDSYLYLWDITRDQNWVFGDIDESYALRQDGKAMSTIADMEKIVYPADRQALHEDLQKIIDGKKQTHNMNYRWINRSGEAVWISCRGTVINDDKGKPFVMIGMVSDKKLRFFYNPLTKLFNKNKMLIDLKKDFYGKNTGYFMMIGVDNLANINLKHGRRYGDEVIRRCAEVFEKRVSLHRIWHVENNCFAMYLDADNENEVKKIFNGFLKEMSDTCTLSAGVVPNNTDMFGTEEDMYSCVEMTFEKAKASGIGSVSFFSQQDLEQRVKSLQFLDELQLSVKNGCEGFYLCYQPQVKTGNYQVYGAEALLRYHSEKRGQVYPDEFIPLLEQSKLINVVGMWVLATALEQCKEWRRFDKDFSMSVNVSAVQLKEKDIAERVLNILRKSGLPGSALTIEITESIQLQGNDNFMDIFNCWRDAGIEISIDDFGTGYASMGYLKKLNVNEIKIDRMFVRGVEEATYNYRLISNMIEFAKNNSIRICCEGVESVQELTVLEGLSPNLIQGYLFSKPCEKDKFENLFLNSHTSEYEEHEKFVRKLYEFKDRMQVIYFNTKDILRKTELGLWIIRINEKENYCELHTDETMEKVIAVDRKYTPQECYHYWYDRIDERFKDYVDENVKKMIESDKIVQLHYRWKHPKLGRIMVRCCGRRVEDSDGMITLEGYHRMISNVENAVKDM